MASPSTNNQETVDVPITKPSEFFDLSLHETITEAGLPALLPGDKLTVHIERGNKSQARAQFIKGMEEYDLLVLRLKLGYPQVVQICERMDESGTIPGPEDIQTMFETMSLKVECAKKRLALHESLEQSGLGPSNMRSNAELLRESSNRKGIPREKIEEMVAEFLKKQEEYLKNLNAQLTDSGKYLDDISIMRPLLGLDALGNASEDGEQEGTGRS